MRKITFFTAYNRPKAQCCSCGDKEYIHYIERTDKVTGKTYLEESERINIRDYIKSSYEETKIENILARAGAGDQTALNRIQGLYADITGIPRTIAEMHSKIKDAYGEFDRLPIEIKQEFNNDAGQFIAGFSNGKVQNVIQKLSQNQQKTETAAEPKVVQNPQTEVK